MRPRSLILNIPEVVIPAIVAVVLGLVAFLFLNPVFGQGRSSDPGVVRIYASVPRHDYESIIHGIQMAIDDAGARAGDFRIEFVPLDDAIQIEEGNWKWQPDVELANARRAVEDPDAMVYIGTYNSGAAKISIPVLNRVSMPMISPGNTYPGLTKPGTGSAGEPYIYYPLGIRNYFRVVPADDLQGAAAAAYAREIGAKSVFVLDDTELYGKGIAAVFARESRNLGLTVAGGPESIDVNAQNYSTLASRIVRSGADLVYFGGSTSNHPNLVLRDLRSAGFTGGFMSDDAVVGGTFISQLKDVGLDNDDQVYATLVGLPAAKLTGVGADWYRRYKQQYPDDSNEDFAPFGYEAGRVALHGIATANRKDREAIRQVVAATDTSQLTGDNILGDWSFDGNGDTSLVTVSVQHLGRDPGTGQFAWLFEGIMQYNPDTKQWTLGKQ
ncbi:MAG: branched-chain amino acid ABC transporter substrate-binding protein [Chloroflexia bacterium]